MSLNGFFSEFMNQKKMSEVACLYVLQWTSGVRIRGSCVPVVHTKCHALNYSQYSSEMEMRHQKWHSLPKCLETSRDGRADGC